MGLWLTRQFSGHLSIPEQASGHQSGLCLCRQISTPDEPHLLISGMGHCMVVHPIFIPTPLNKKLLQSALQKHRRLCELRDLPYGKFSGSWYPQVPKVHQIPIRVHHPPKVFPCLSKSILLLLNPSSCLLLKQTNKQIKIETRSMSPSKADICSEPGCSCPSLRLLGSFCP